MSASYAYAGASAAAGFVVLVILFYFAVIGIAIADYIMTSLSLYTIAKRRGVPNPWIAWIPVASVWTLGDIADEYDGRNGIKRKWRVILLTLSIIAAAAVIISVLMLIGAISVSAASAPRYYYYGGYKSYNVYSNIAGLLIVVYIAVIASAGAAAVLGVLKHICLYKVYESAVPEKSAKYMILSLLVPLAGSICLMKCRFKGHPQPKNTVNID